MSANLSLNVFSAELELKAGVQCNKEQREFYQDFSVPTFCFACPGTGKTTVSALGLIKAELYDGIPGDNIYAVSFTNESAAELKVRHRRYCKAIKITPTINTSTLHSLCTQIIRENYKVLDMDSVTISKGTSDEDIIDYLERKCARYDIPIAPNNVKFLLYAIRSLNSSLAFSRDAVENTVAFKRLGITYEQFMTVRSDLYQFYRLSELVPVDSILLYTLEILLREPKISEEFKKKCKILLADEAQDLSLLQLRILTLLSDTVILVGDVKQRIYSFNGACQEVVLQFRKYFPNARECTLSQTYRCANEIANFATQLILPNKVDNSVFVGKGSGGKVNISADFDIHKMVDTIAEDYFSHNHTFSRSVMFLFRNNFSVIPVVEALYQKQIPIRVRDYVPAFQIEYIKQLVSVVELCLHPFDLERVTALVYLIPELRKYKSGSRIPIYKIAKKMGISLLDVEYDWSDIPNGAAVFKLLKEVQVMLQEHKSMGDIINKLWPAFMLGYVNEHARYDTLGVKYYTGLVQSLMHKTYERFLKDELEKQKIIKECNDSLRGVRCFTFHGSKGLEADVVNIMDANDEIIPSQNALKRANRYKCEAEAAVAIRDERSLVYVAVTRAKEEVNIGYSTELSSLFTTENHYESYDKFYEDYKRTYTDVEVFEDFYMRRLIFN